MGARSAGCVLTDTLRLCALCVCTCASTIVFDASPDAKQNSFPVESTSRQMWCSLCPFVLGIHRRVPSSWAYAMPQRMRKDDAHAAVRIIHDLEYIQPTTHAPPMLVLHKGTACLGCRDTADRPTTTQLQQQRPPKTHMQARDSAHTDLHCGIPPSLGDRTAGRLAAQQSHVCVGPSCR